MPVLKTSYSAAAVMAAALLGACSSNNPDDAPAPQPMGNSPPVLGIQPDRTADQDSTVAFEFTVGDRETASADLVLSAVAQHNNVFPLDGISIAGSGATRTLTLVPLEAATGVTGFSLTVRDGGAASVTRSFLITLNARRASVLGTTTETFAKAESAEPTAVNGFTFDQDADAEGSFDALIPEGGD